jgi:hypothetical protein
MDTVTESQVTGNGMTNLFGYPMREFELDEIDFHAFGGDLELSRAEEGTFIVSDGPPSFRFINPFGEARLVVTHNGAVVIDRHVDAAEEIWITSAELSEVGVLACCSYHHGSVLVDFSPAQSAETKMVKQTAQEALERLMNSHLTDLRVAVGEFDDEAAGEVIANDPTAFLRSMEGVLVLGGFGFSYAEQEWLDLPSLHTLIGASLDDLFSGMGGVHIVAVTSSNTDDDDNNNDNNGQFSFIGRQFVGMFDLNEFIGNPDDRKPEA